MQNRITVAKLVPEAYRHLISLDRYVSSAGIDPLLIELVKIRASQINGCAYCINLHTGDAMKKGENVKRIFALNAWRESPWFSDEERAALALTEEITKITERHVSDEVYTEMTKYYDDEMIAKFIVLIVLINSWNRISISTNTIPGD